MKSKDYYDNKIKFHEFKVDDLVYIMNKRIKPGLNKNHHLISKVRIKSLKYFLIKLYN